MPFSGAAGLAAAQQQYGAQQYNPRQYMAYNAYGAGAYGAYQVGNICIEGDMSHLSLGMKGALAYIDRFIDPAMRVRGGEMVRGTIPWMAS